MRIAYFYKEEWEKDFISKKLPDHTFNFIAGTTGGNPTVGDSDAQVLTVFMNSKIGPAELDRFPSVKLVATRSTGFDHVDLAECKKRGIAVANVPAYGEHTVAEFAMALLLALSRRIYDAYHRIKVDGSFSQEGLRGFDLRGRTIGIVGTGHIGAHMIAMAKGFGMQVIAFDVRQNEELQKKYDVQYMPLEELLAKSDIISLHAPYNEHTHHMINSNNYKLIKPGCYLINTARGGLVETAALVAALDENILAGAGLDVLEEEGELAHEDELLHATNPNEGQMKIVLADHYLIKHPRVIVTQHIAFNTQEAVERILTTNIENIAAFAAGAPINSVTM